jgi:hypothetical protein
MAVNPSFRELEPIPRRQRLYGQQLGNFIASFADGVIAQVALGFSVRLKASSPLLYENAVSG